MLVVDTNVIAYLYLPTTYSAFSEQLLEIDSLWAAPLLWRSELRNVLCNYQRKKTIDLTSALAIQDQAEALMNGNEFAVTSMSILALAASSGCSAYDCEFVSLARELNTQLITADKKVIRAFPDCAIGLREFVVSA
jgi:predicted nucleic acid-binding protein